MANNRLVDTIFLPDNVLPFFPLSKLLIVKKNKVAHIKIEEKVASENPSAVAELMPLKPRA